MSSINDSELTLGSSDYEFSQIYIEEYSRYMNEKKFKEKYREKSMGERIYSERVADVFEIEERMEWKDEEEEYYDYD